MTAPQEDLLVERVGPALQVTGECGFVITPRSEEQVVLEMAAAMDQLATDGALADRHPGGRRAAMQLDTLVHRLIYRACHNPYLATDLDRYYNLSLRIWYLLLDRLPEVDHAAEHLPMMEAILAGDAAQAQASAVAHVSHFHQSVRDAL